MASQKNTLDALRTDIAEMVAMASDDCRLGVDQWVDDVEEWQDALCDAVTDGLQSAFERTID